MDYNYNRIILEQYLDGLFKYILEQYGVTELKALFNDLIDGKESNLLNKNVQSEINKYSKDTIRLIIEKNILFSLENSVVSIKKTYWKVLKDRSPRINRVLLSHYYDKYIDLLKNKQVIYKAETIEDLNKKYNDEIKNSMMLNHNFDDIIKNTSNISLNHMENLNGNGRTISIGTKRKGGIFLSRESNIGYGNFINKEEFINKIRKNKSYKVTVNGNIGSQDLEEIVNRISQRINISTNEKNSNSRIIIDANSNKKAGNIFLGKNGIELPSGDYVSVEELSLAINKFITEKNRKTRKNRIIKTKEIFKKFAATAALAVSLLTTSISSVNNSNIQVVSAENSLDKFYSNNEDETKNIILNEQNVIENNQTSAEIHTQEEQLKTNNDFENSNETVQEDNSVNNADIEYSTENEELETNTNVISSTEDLMVDGNKELTEDNNIDNQENIKLDENVQEFTNSNEANTEIEENMNELSTDENNNSIEQTNLETSDMNDEEKSQISEEKTVLDDVTSTDDMIPQTVDSSEEVQDVEKENSNLQIDENTSSLSEINGNDIANYAVQFVGNPYVYGGTNLTEGTDCSGFTQSVYSNFGVNIARDSSSQINSGANIGTNIEDALPGDLLCFNGHVGIYIGNGQMVHAANPERGIVINDVNYDKDKTLKAIVRPTGVNENEITAKTR